ncbi:MAG: sulfite oxidase-like oxidoreductase [Actinomycetota bacterium]
MSPSPGYDHLPPGQKVARGWPVLHYGPVPSFDPATWDLKVWGEVERSITLSYQELRALPAARSRGDFHCVTKFSVLDNEWEGVAFSVIADMCRPKPEAGFVMAHCEHGYEANLPLELMLDDDVLLAWGRNGERLTPEHGYPLRLVVPKRYAWKSAKWVRGVEFMAKDRRGFWEERGYHNSADPLKEERYSFQEKPGQKRPGMRSIWRRFR